MPTQIASSSQDIELLAYRVRSANKELKNITGWDGGVLGLNKRVILDPSYAFASGITLIKKLGFIHINAWWNNLSHEWFHALDTSLSNNLTSSPSLPLSRQININNLTQAKIINATSKQVLFEKRLINYRTKHSNSDYLNYENNNSKSLPSLNKDNQNIPQIERQLWDHLLHPKLNFTQINQIKEKAYEKLPMLKSSDGSILFNSIRLTDQFIGSSHNNKQLYKQSSPWLYWRNLAKNNVKKFDKFAYIVETKDQKYLSSPTELMTFAFASHVSVFIRNHDVNNLKEQPNNNNIESKTLNDPKYGYSSSLVYEPSIIEVKSQSKAWDSFFKSLNQWWSLDTQLHVPKNIKSNRSPTKSPLTSRGLKTFN